jgi:hypothetical protein
MSLSSWLGATLCSRYMLAKYSFKKESLSLSRSLSICSWIWATIVLVIWLLGKAPKLQLSSLKLSISLSCLVLSNKHSGSCDVVASLSTLYLSLFFLNSQSLFVRLWF